MTFKECIYDVREALKLLSIDSDTTDRQIAFLMHNYRATVIRQFMTNNPGEYRDMLTQSLYMETELVDNSRFPLYGTLGYTILSTKLALPNIVGQQMYKEIEVRSLDIVGAEIEIIGKVRATEVKYAPSNFIYGYRDDDGKLYFVSNNSQYKAIKQVVVTAVLENPEDELTIHNSSGDLGEYPITSHLWVTVKEMVVNHIARSLSIPIDIINNKRDEQLTTGTQKQD